VADVALATGFSSEEQHRRASLFPVRRNGYNRDLEIAVRKNEMITECPIWLELDGLAGNRDLCFRMSSALKNNWGVQVH
jgi:hypothetical protein